MADIMKKFLCVMIILGLCLSFVSCTEQKEVSRTVMMMDTIVTVTCYGEKAQEGCDRAISEIQRLELLFSPYIETSDIYQINKNAYLSPVTPSLEVYEVLKRCRQVCVETNGAFDITLKPLSDLWNIKSENPKVPSEEEILAAKEKCGYENLVLKDGTVSFLKEGMALDLGGSVKGYAADRAVLVLKEVGVENALLDLGGNVYALGKSPKGRAWKVGLQDPKGERGEHFKAIELSDETCVTSGSYERYFEENGKIYHHIIDPHTGYSADSGLISVSVKGKSSFEADMASTAAFVMGMEDFSKIKNKLSIDEVIYVDKTNNYYQN